MAITDAMPGVTRDPVTGLIEREGRTVTLVDTGGIRPGAGGVDGVVSRRSLSVLEKADCIVFLLEVGELTGEDEEVLSVVRRFADKVILAVNKVDTERREEGLGDYYGLGFRDVVAISSAHGRNCDELEELLFRKIDFSRYTD